MLAAAPLRAQCPDGTPPPCATARPAPAPALSVAVLYFENQSRDTADAYLAVGLTEAIIAKLGEVPRLTVKSRYAVRRFQGSAAQADPAAIGRALGAAYLVTGGVQRAGGRLRVTAELARAASGDRVWGQEYERADGDVFAIQEDIARGVATGVAGRLFPAERASLAARPTRNNEAYDHLLRGDVLLAQRTPASAQRAIAEYQAATRLDPSFVSAWAKIALANGLWLRWEWDPEGRGRPAPDSFLARAVAASDRALALDSSSSDAWMAHGYLMRFRHPRDLDGLEAGLRRAVALNPRNAEAWHQLGDALWTLGRDSEAVAATRTALALEPGRPISLLNLAASAPPRQALLLLDSALAIDPQFYAAYLLRFRKRLLVRDSAGARADVEAMERLSFAEVRLVVEVSRAQFDAAIGDTATARQRVRRIAASMEPSGPLSLRFAIAYGPALTALGDTTAALDALERAPRGADLWEALGIWQTTGRPDSAMLALPRYRHVYEDSRPPWVRP